MRKQGMAAQYTEITLEEMERFLKRGWRALRPKAGTERGEVYYDLALSPNVMIRVWTSINPRHETGAGVGQDAIRIQLLTTKTKRPLTKGKAPIVKRTQGWKNSLQDRIEDAIEIYEDQEDYFEERAGGEARETPPAEREPVQEPRPSGQGEPGEVTFSKLRSGDWGLRSTTPLTPGASVTVTKKDRSTTTVTVGQPVWSGGGIYLYESGGFGRRYADAPEEEEPDYAYART